MEIGQQLLLQHHLAPILLDRLAIELDALLFQATADQGAPAHRALAALLLIQLLLIEEPAIVALQAGALEGQLSFLLYLEQAIFGLITDCTEIDCRFGIDCLWPMQPLQALEQLVRPLHHFTFGHIGQQHGKHLSGITGLQSTIMFAHEGTNGGTRFQQQVTALQLERLGLQLFKASEIDQQHATTHHARLHDGALQPVVKKQPVADTGHLVDIGVAADKVVEAAALLASIRQLGEQVVEGLTGGHRPLFGGVMIQLGEFVIEDQLGANAQQLGTAQLLAQPANGVPETEHHDKDAERDAGHRPDGVLRLLEGALQLEISLHVSLVGQRQAVWLQQLFIDRILHVAEPVDPLVVLTNLQLHHMGSSQQGGQPTAHILHVMSHIQLLVDHLDQRINLLLLQLHAQLAKAEHPANQHGCHGGNHAQGDKGDKLCCEFHAPFRMPGTIHVTSC